MKTNVVKTKCIKCDGTGELKIKTFKDFAYHLDGFLNRRVVKCNECEGNGYLPKMNDLWVKL